MQTIPLQFRPELSKAVSKGSLYISLSALALLLLLAVGVFAWTQGEQHLPSDQEARRQFDSHRTEYIRFAARLRQDLRAGIIESDGSVSSATRQVGPVEEYRDMMHSLGAKAAVVREDGSIEFELWGVGCAICSDSYKGLRYAPGDFKADARTGWMPKLVKSLDSNDLPQTNGSINDGLYVVQIEPEWFIYRSEYHE